MDIKQSIRIIQNAVLSTETRWREYATKWQDIDTIYLLRGYEQQGFRIFILGPIFNDKEILSIDAIGSILDNSLTDLTYSPDFVKGGDSEFYQKLHAGAYGENGIAFYDAIMKFYFNERKHCGRFYWKLLWYMLQSCSYLRNNHGSRFKQFLLNEYRLYSGDMRLTESQFLDISEIDWRNFTSTVKPWKPLKGIGENVFDFIIGDIEDARFARDSYKFDSANQYFLKVTGIESLIRPFDRETTIAFLRKLGLQYTLRQINAGIYTYCSVTEAQHYGFCRNQQKCDSCVVKESCERKF